MANQQPQQNKQPTADFHTKNKSNRAYCALLCRQERNMVTPTQPSRRRIVKTRAVEWLCLVVLVTLSLPSHTHGFTFSHPRASIQQRQTLPSRRCISSSPTRTLPLFQARSDEEEELQLEPDIVVAEASLGLKRVSWLSWWAQMILTVTSSVILIFAKNVVKNREAQVNFFLAGTGK